MRQWLVAGALLSACSVAAAQQIEPAPEVPGKKVTWFPTFGGSGEQASVARNVGAEKHTFMTVVETPAERCKRERATLQRRNDVIIKLRGIALRTGDKELEARVNELQERVFDIHLQKMDLINTELPLDGPTQPARNVPISGNATPSASREDRQ